MQSQDINKVIEVGNIVAQYGATPVLDGVSLSVNRGDFVAITGPNGGGKSTLLKILLRILKPVKGSVTYYKGGEVVDSLTFGYLPQKNNIDSRFPITVREVVASGLYRDIKNRWGKFGKEANARSDGILELVGMEDLQSRVIGALSGGQLQRALFGRALISKPEVVVLDEPLSYIDRTFTNQMYKIVEDVSKDATVIVVSHEMTVISELANRHLLVDHDIHECHASRHYLKTDCDV